MQILIRNLASELFTLEWEQNWSVAALKRFLWDTRGYIPDAVILISEWRVLKDEDTLHDLGITEQKIIQIVLRERKYGG